MKEFAHPQTEQAPADLNRALTTTLTVARNEYKYAAVVETQLEELPTVVCNLSDLNQVFLNLIVNAAHAIEDVISPGELGTIRVSTARDGNSVLVTVADTGGGIPDEVRTRIFDPFFTTKEVGRGSGQGLAIARAVVDKHGGSIGVETVSGAGTAFTIRLPISGVDVAERA
jgi:signal transduction histidine kinase